MKPTPVVRKNAVQGKEFEELFKIQARMEGLVAKKIPLSCRIIGPKKYLPIKSELDFQLINKETSEIAFLDAKSFISPRFSYSELSKHQVALASLYNDCGLVAGFVVHFKKKGVVCFFPGSQIAFGEGLSFGPDDGTLLGKTYTFKLRPLFVMGKKRAKKLRRVRSS